MIRESRRILLVEDEVDTRDSMRDLLELEGYEVETARNGREGLEVLGEDTHCMVLLDLMMPEMDGWDFLAALEQRGVADPPVVILSAFGDRKDKRLAGRPFLAKPVDVDELLETVDRYCG